MILYNLNHSNTPFIIKTNWNGAVNQTFGAPNSKIYFTPDWFYQGNELILSCDVEAENMKAADGFTLGNLSWNDGGRTSDGQTLYHGLLPFRGYHTITANQLSVNGKYHFSKAIKILGDNISYVSTNKVLEQGLSWRLDYAASGRLTISNVLLFEKNDSKTSLDKTGNINIYSCIEDVDRACFYTEGLYAKMLYEI